MYCNNCGNINDENTKFCVSCGNKLETKTQETGENNITSIKPSKKHIKIIIALVAVIITVCLAILGHKASSNPVIKLKSAMKSTLKAKSAEFEIVVTEDDDDPSKVYGAIEFDSDKRFLSIYLDSGRDGEIWIRYDNSETKMFHEKNGKLTEIDGIDAEEAEELFEALFDALEGNADSSSIKHFMEDNEIDEFIDVDEFENESKKLAKKLVSKENLENILGYSKKKNGSETIYSFKPDLYELTLFLIDEGETLLTKDAYFEIRNGKKDMDSDDLPIMNMDFIVQGKYITGYDYEYTDGYDSVDIEFRLNNINKAKVDFPE